MNVDIGGGTANAAIFRVGQHIASSALAVGGRQVVVERTSGLVRHIAPPGQAIINALNLPIRVGQVAGLDSLQRFTDCMADLVADLVTGVESDLGRQVQLSPPFAPAVAAGSKCLFISGGVGAYYYDPPLMDSLTNALRHDDLGVSCWLNRCGKTAVYKPSPSRRQPKQSGPPSWGHPARRCN
jgi:ethanolamine utilization protein EutA